MDALSVGIIIIVGCVVFLFISAILIYQNAQTEAKLLKKRQMKKMGRASSRGSAAAVMIELPEEEVKPKPVAPAPAPAPVPVPVKMAPPESNDADSGHETDTNLAAPLLVATAAGVAAGAVVGGATTTSTSPPAVNKKDPTPKASPEPVPAPDPDTDHDLPTVAVPAALGAGVVATTMAAEPPPKKKAAKKVAIQPVSDFDDYKSMRPKMLPDPDFHSSPPPARYSDPPPAPIFKEQQAPTAGRRAMARKIKMQEGMDF